MTAQLDAPASGDAITEGVACPFCGILCDDLVVRHSGRTLEVTRNGCAKARSGFERILPASVPAIRGNPVALQEAVREAARLIGSTRQPLFGGLGTEVDGMRAVLSLADKARGVVDHAASDGLFRNFRVLQTSGWITTTLTEARNRADLFVIVASDVHTLHPRFFERVVTPSRSMFCEPPPPRDVVFIGSGLDTTAATGPRIGKLETLSCRNEQASEVIATLRAIINGSPVTAETVAGIAVTALRQLATRIQAAAYPVFVWAPASLDFGNADLLVHMTCELVKDLNRTQRAAGLSLGGNEGAASAAAVCAWQSGYPLRVSFESARPEHDMMRYSIARMLADGEGDCLVWLSSFSPELAPPETKLPLVLLATPGTSGEKRADVFFPVATPGIDHTGRIIRCDTVVSLPLRNLGRSDLPRAADVISSIEAAL